MSETAEQSLHHSCRSDIMNNENENKNVVLMESFPKGVSFFDWDKGNVIGKGSFGDVYLGMPTKPYLCNVAIKVAPFRDATSLIREKFILEQFIGSLEIVQFIGDASTTNDYVYNMILEYAAGGTLADLIKAHKKLPEQDVRGYLKMILQGLSCIHAKGYVHNDLKPENILVFPSGDGKIKLKIADFSLSKKYKNKYYEREEKESRKHKLKYKGTPIYMSSESLIEEVEPSLDIWSLGCVLIKMISGKELWNDCPSKREVLSNCVFEKKVPNNIPKELSNQGKDFLQKCFERNHEQRWSADMLLKHPYLVEEEKITKKSFKSLPFTIGLCTITILVVIFCYITSLFFKGFSSILCRI